MTTTTTYPTRPVPDDLAAAARAWAAPLIAAAGAGLRALYVYGSALGPGFDRAASDVNLLLVVEALPFDRLAALAVAVRQLPAPAEPGAATGFRFAPLLLTTATVAHSADVFPVDFLDLRDRRALLAGEDVLAGLNVPLGNLRHQCEYELRSRLIGLRQAFLRAGGADGTAHMLVARAAGSSGSLFRHLLTLRGRPYPDAPEALARAVAEAYGIDPAGLDAPFAARKDAAVDEAAARRRLGAYLEALDQLVRAVDADPAR